MPQNLMPYRGIGLEAFDRGGPDFVTETVRREREEFGKGELQPGDAFWVSGSSVVPGAEKIVFAVMPWVWQGSPMDASKRLRYCVKEALRKAWSLHPAPKSVALPNIACGIFGYEPHGSSRIILEEAFEALLQIEASEPQYSVERLTLIDSRLETAKGLQEAMHEVTHRWLPDYRMTTAAQYWGKETQRLMVLPSGSCSFNLKRHRVKFRQRHGVKRRAQAHYNGNIKPVLWRAAKVLQPPPMMVYRRSGEAVEKELQHKPRPYYFRGVSHWLFPSRRSGFHSLRKSSSGHWVAQVRQVRLRELVLPRL